MNLINRTNVKKAILHKLETERPHLEIDRVSSRALNQINAKVQLIINEAVARHPSKGKTFLEV